MKERIMKNEQIDDLQTILFDFDLQMGEITTDIALLQQSQKIMIKEQSEHKMETKEWFKAVNETLKNLPNDLTKIFATKLELKELEKTVETNETTVNKHDKMIFFVISSIITAVLSFIGFIIYKVIW